MLSNSRALATTGGGQRVILARSRVLSRCHSGFAGVLKRDSDFLFSLCVSLFPWWFWLPRRPYNRRLAPLAMGGQATANFVKSRRINSAPILLAFVVCIDDYVNSGLLHKTICSFLRTIPLCTATTLQRLLRQRQVATSPRGQRAVLRFSSGSLYSWGGVLALGSALGFRLPTWSMWVSLYHNSFNNFSFD